MLKRLLIVLASLLTLATIAHAACCGCPDGGAGVCCDGSCGCTWTNPPEPPGPDPLRDRGVTGDHAADDCYCFCSDSAAFSYELEDRWSLETIINLRCHDMPIRKLAVVLDAAVRDVRLAIPVDLLGETRDLDVRNITCRAMIRDLGLLILRE